MELRRIEPVLPESIFGVAIRPHLLHQAVVMQLNNRRAGTASTKTRGKVRGGGKKPWRQKGSGRARAGSVRSPIWVGGGTTFGPLPKDYTYRIPKTARRQAVLSALSLKRQEEKLVVVEPEGFSEIKTRVMAEALASLGVGKSLFVIAEGNQKIELSARNLPNVKVLRVAGLNVYDLLRFEYLVLTRDALQKIEERFSQ
jgi:large subunit ribosomal protein L4